MIGLQDRVFYSVTVQMPLLIKHEDVVYTYKRALFIVKV